jgi:hypothetical protein
LHWPRRPLHSLVEAVAAEDTAVAVVEDMVAAAVASTVAEVEVDSMVAEVDFMVAEVASMVASLAVAFAVVAPTSQAEVLEAAGSAGDTAEASAVVMAATAAMATGMAEILPAV